MKGKNVFILLLVLAITAGMVAIAILGVGNVPSNSTSSGDEPQFELMTDENGELVTDENGSAQVVPIATTESSAEATTADGAEAVEGETTEGESVSETTTEERIGYGSYKNIKQGLDLKGGVYIVYEAEKEGTPSAEEMAAAVSAES